MKDESRRYFINNHHSDGNMDKAKHSRWWIGDKESWPIREIGQEQLIQIEYELKVQYSYKLYARLVNKTDLVKDNRKNTHGLPQLQI